MSRENHYQLYLDQNLQLAQTIVIKSQLTIDAINRYLNMIPGGTPVNQFDPTSWKYYLNVSGEYHPSDTMMTVVSMDTLEEIDFTQDNLQIHRATARAYQFGTRQYQELVNRYPTQVMLIIGILYPIDIQAAIAAPDGAILGYPSELVEPNEYTLIEKLQAWINAFQLRWNNPQYAFSDNLYPAANLGIMYLNLLPALLTMRLGAAKTNEAHSYHVRQYLGSHGVQDDYIDQLSLSQSLWLYRNIKYLLLNIGKVETFNLLMQHLLTERNLPLSEYNMHHDVSSMPDQLEPNLVFRNRPLNFKDVLDTTDYVTLDQLLRKEDSLARDNIIEREDHEAEIQAKFQNSLSSVLKTKLLECSVIDYSDSSPYNMVDILMNNWLDQSTRGLYKTMIGIINPKNGERIPLVAKDAYCFMLYAYWGSLGYVLDEIPSIVANRVPRYPIPSTDTLMKMVKASLVPRSTIDAIQRSQPLLSSVISTDAFYNQCEELYKAAQFQRGMMSYQEHMDGRGYVKGVVEALYCDRVCQLAEPGTRYQDWFAERNIMISEFSQDELSVMYQDVVQQATGLSLHTTKSLADIQRAMIGIMRQLSSYSVQFWSTINASKIRMMDTPMIRLGDRNFAADTEFYLDEVAGGIDDNSTNVIHQLEDEAWPERSDPTLSVDMAYDFALPQPDLVTPDPQDQVFSFRADISRLGPSFSDQYPTNIYGIIPKPGLAEFLALTQDQRASVIYQPN